jgi:hypothetical protein
MGRLPGSTYRVMKRFRVRLRPTPLKRESPEWFAQRALDRDIARLRAVTPALHRLHPVASALTAPMRMCSVHKLMLPTSVMLRFVRAYRPDGTVRVCVLLALLFLLTSLSTLTHGSAARPGHGGVRPLWAACRQGRVGVGVLADGAVRR